MPGFVFPCDCGQEIWCASEYHKEQHLHSRNHQRALAKLEQANIRTQKREEQNVVEVSKLDEVLAQKREELKALDARLQEVLASINSASVEKETVLNSAKKEARIIREGVQRKVKTTLEGLEFEKSEILKEIERLKGIPLEVERVDACQRVLSDTRLSMEALRSFKKQVLKDLILVEPLLEGSKNWFSAKDLRSEARERLLTLAKQGAV
jgi:hypothetical protein